MAGMRRNEYISRLEKTSAGPLLRSPDIDYAVFEIVLADRIEDLRFQITVADKKKFHLRRACANLRQRRCQHVDAMPTTERANEANHRLVVEPKGCAYLAPFFLACRRVFIAID